MSQIDTPNPQIETLEALKKCFEEVVPCEDARTTINPLSFIVSLVFCYLGDSKTFSLEAIRRFMKNALDTNISKSAFWERLAGNRLNNYLQLIVAKLMVRLTHFNSITSQLLIQMNIIGIWVHDSTSITLLPKAKNDFPGTFTDAGIKWHATFDILKGTLTWLQFTPTSTHDSNCFPPLEMLNRILIIFDLGYWGYDLLYAIENAGGFFLSRLKSNSVIYIEKVIQGLPKDVIGKSLLSLSFENKKGIIEVITTKIHNDHLLRYRVIGFWNPIDKKHHWYITNLVIAAHIIYPLYRLRWQIELIFKACKNSLNANQITSCDKNIIESLLLASIAAHLSSYTILKIGKDMLEEGKQWAISFQRVAKVAVLLSREFILFLLNPSREHLDNLLHKIKLFVDEIYDPNYRKRETSLMRIRRLLIESKS
jgi:hypothetical protein